MVNSTAESGSASSPYLLVRVGGLSTQKVVLEATLGIGRAEDNGLRLSDPKVSRYHARITREEDAFTLTDLGSANGTLVNGVRLTAPHSLQHGELITVGDAELTYQEPAAATADTITDHVVVPPPPAPPPAPQAKGRNRGLVIGIALVAVFLLSVLGALVVFRLVPDLLGSPGVEVEATSTLAGEVVTSATQTPTEEPIQTPSATVLARTPVVSAVTPDLIETETEGLLIQADALAQRSKFEESTAIYEELVRQMPGNALPEVGWAWALILDHEAGSALKHALRAVDLDPTNADAATVLARAYLEMGDEAPALNMAQKAVELDAGSAEAQAVLAEALMLSGQLQDAVEAADMALVHDSQNANAHHIRGWLYQEADEDLGRAASELQTAAGLQPELWLRRHELGLLLLEAGDNATAILALQDALGMRPKATTYAAIGRAYFQLGQYDQAQAALEQALTSGAQDADSYALLAATSAYQGLCDDAETYYNEALALNPTEALALEAKEVCEAGGTPPTAVARASATPGATPQSTPKATSRPAPPPKLSGRIAFPVWNRERGKYDVLVANADGSDRHVVVEEMRQPAFSPDGQWLAVNGERHEQMNLFIVRPDGSGLKEISKHIEDNLPFWSPRNNGLAFSSTMHGDKQSRVYVIDRVPFEGRQQEGRPLNFGPDDVRGDNPAWTADDRVVYKGCDSTVEPARCGLFIIASAKGAHPATLLTEHTEDAAPATSGIPGDNRIAFMSSRDGNWEIYIINADGSGLRRLTKDAAHDGLPAWSPDGKSLAFVSNKGGVWAVWVMSPDGSNRSKLFDLGGGGLAFEWQNEQISWGPP